MPLPTPPTEIPRFATDVSATVTTPPSAKQDTGWVGTEKPPAGVFNWLAKWTYQWIVYARDAIAYVSSNALFRDGSNTVAGVLTPDADNTRDLGATGTRFRNLWLGGAVNAQTVLASANVSANGTVFTGNVQCNHGTEAASFGQANTLTHRTIPKAWAAVVTDGAGGIALGGSSDAGANVLSVTLPSPTVARITFAQAMAANGKYAVFFGASAQTGLYSTLVWNTTKNASFVDVQAINPGGSPVNLATTGISFDVLVMGVQ